MVDEMFDRNYQAGRADLNAALQLVFARIAEGVSNSFRVLNRIEYSAPWAAKRTRARCQ